jgi:hypothetical protein
MNERVFEPRYLAGLARILDALRKAGVPEG